jgi:hypothetical protein
MPRSNWDNIAKISFSQVEIEIQIFIPQTIALIWSGLCIAGRGWRGRWT